MRARQELLKALAAYPYREETEVRDRVRDLVRSEPRCFEKDCWRGHVTGSAWVLSLDARACLLILHRKLGKWLQPGGHSDGSADTWAVALREAEEETGLKVRLASDEIFDLDVHEIPARGTQPAHLHFDVRFAMWADGSSTPTASDESNAALWVPLEDVPRYTREESVLRMVRKTANLGEMVKKPPKFKCFN